MFKLVLDMSGVSTEISVRDKQVCISVSEQNGEAYFSPTEAGLIAAALLAAVEEAETSE